jgi:hypothetical protein
VTRLPLMHWEETRDRPPRGWPCQMNVPADTCDGVLRTLAAATRGRHGTLVPLGDRRWAQSSGILIQPWRMAYTTAWVRSFTESFRRMELMWFFTVCSLIDSA